MRTIEQLGDEFFYAVDESLTGAVVGLHTQLAQGNAEELVNLCNAIKDTEEDLYNMANKLSELSDRLMMSEYLDRVVAYKSLSFRIESLIDKLIDFVDVAQLEFISNDIKANALDDLNEQYKKYVETKNEYNL